MTAQACRALRLTAHAVRPAPVEREEGDERIDGRFVQETGEQIGGAPGRLNRHGNGFLADALADAGLHGHKRPFAQTLGKLGGKRPPRPSAITRAPAIGADA